jgi:hypothetical protein
MSNKPDPDFMYNWIREKSGKTTKMENKQITMWTCQFCGKDTSNVEYDYLNGYDHLSCALEQEQKQQYVKMEYGPGDAVIDRPIYIVDEFDHCILCGVETAYKRSTHIDMRIGYVEGAGQLCPKCYNFDTISVTKDENPIPLDSHRQLFTVSEYMVLSTPNDQELGAKVRQLYWENKK